MDFKKDKQREQETENVSSGRVDGVTIDDLKRTGDNYSKTRCAFRRLLVMFFDHRTAVIEVKVAGLLRSEWIVRGANKCQS